MECFLVKTFYSCCENWTPCLQICWWNLTFDFWTMNELDIKVCRLVHFFIFLTLLVKIHIFALYEDLQRNRNIFLCKMHQIIVFMMKFTWFSVGKRIPILWKNWSVFSSTWNDKLLRKQAFFNGISLWMWVLTLPLYW